jgi:hypothetical protein
MGKPAVQRRILWFAHEWKLAPVEIAKAMSCRTYDLKEFVKRHDISADWLICGDLKGFCGG